MQHNDNIETPPDGVLITSLLVAAIAQVLRVAVDSQFVVLLGVLVADGRIIGVIRRTIIKEKDLFDFVPHLFRYAVHRPVELVHRVISDHKDSDALLL